MRSDEKQRRFLSIEGFVNPQSAIRDPHSRGFTLIEIMVVIVILGVMIALVAPRLGEIGEANLKRSARHLTGMIHFLRDEAQAKKTVYRLQFDIQDGHYWVEALTLLDDKAGEYRKVSQVIAGEGSLSGNTKFRDIAVPGHPDEPFMLFTPDGWVEHALIHLRDGSDRDFTLLVMPLTGKTELREGYVEER
jgi:prepilin-type N-terminal cleavage/methylation domain-containing protein